jgi:hypothetical protein
VRIVTSPCLSLHGHGCQALVLAVSSAIRGDRAPGAVLNGGTSARCGATHDQTVPFPTCFRERASIRTNLPVWTTGEMWTDCGSRSLSSDSSVLRPSTGPPGVLGFPCRYHGPIRLTPPGRRDPDDMAWPSPSAQREHDRFCHSCAAALLFASFEDVAHAVKRLRVAGTIHVDVGVCSACAANRIRIGIDNDAG